MAHINKSECPVENAKVTSTEPLSAADAKWIQLMRVNYQDPSGRNRIWESAERKTRQKGEVDGVGIVAILYDSTKPRDQQTPQILLQKQFRPPADKVMIEVPAGLLDPAESPATCALRELHEETGYTGILVTSSFLSSFRAGHPPSAAANQAATSNNGKEGETAQEGGSAAAAAAAAEETESFVMYNDPGFTNTNLRMLHVAVDTSLPENAAPQPRLEDGEFIHCFSVPLADLWRECRRLEAQGYGIDARVATLGEGIELARGLGL